jgi:formylglycine-generating enzyme required for sulfatase activity
VKIPEARLTTNQRPGTNNSCKVALLATLVGLGTALLTACSPVPMPAPTPTATLTRPVDGAVMIYVPAGDFLAGAADADGKAGDDERPQHTVNVDAFWIDKTEVTNAQYAQFLNALGSHVDTCGGHQCLEMKEGEDADSHILQRDGRYEVERGFEEHPVIEVTWYGAQAYCQWAGARLPTEAEWEKAARGVDGRIYPWGNGAPDCSKEQYGDCSRATVPVGSKPAGASPYGALDMAGNVWEWVADWYDVSYYLSSPASNPQGPTSGEEKVFRGGSWGYLPQFTRTTDRGCNHPWYAGPNIGFRCAADESALTR